MTTTVQHTHTDLRSSPDEPERSTFYRADCPACRAVAAAGQERAVLLVHLASGVIGTACGKIPGSREVDHFGRTVQHTAHLSLSADPADWPSPLKCCPECWMAAGDSPPGTVSGERDAGAPNSLSEEEIMNTTTTTTCPRWCTNHTYDNDGTPLSHRSAELGTDFGVDLHVVHDIEPGGLVGPYVDLNASDCQLTGIEAGRLAVALLRAADQAEPGALARALVEAMEAGR